MKNSNPYALLRNVFLILLFFLGVQTFADAQFRLINNTTCTVFFQVTQHDNTTVVPCDNCNTSGLIAVPSNGVFVYPAQNSCGPEYWQGFKYFTSIFNSGGSYNPGLAGSCGVDGATLCGANPINVSWFLLTATGAGPATVLLN